MHEIEDQTNFYNSKAKKTGWRDFIRLDFIKNLLPYGPSILELKGLKVKWLNRINVRWLSWDFACADFINPLSCQAAKLPNFGKSLTAFTMAEILISLTIIGIIAAITLPSLRANINEKTWATQKKALYSRLSQAISMLPSLNGYGQYSGDWDEDNNNVSVSQDTAAARFVSDGLAKVLNINDICTIPANTSTIEAREELKKCGISPRITNSVESKIDFPTRLSELNPIFIGTYTSGSNTLTNPQRNIDTVAAVLVTKNNESIAVFYNPNCISFDQRISHNLANGVANAYYPQPHMCANFVYDLNGLKGPNKVGKDIGFITAFYPVEPVIVAPSMPIAKNANNNKTLTHTGVAAACRIQDKDSRVPNIDELQSIFFNKNFLGIGSMALWSSTISGGSAWYMQTGKGILGTQNRTSKNYVRCIKR